MTKLLDWSLYTLKDKAFAQGTVLGHSRLSDGMHIYTSIIQNAEILNERELRFWTRNTQYDLKFSEINLEKLNYTRDTMKKIGLNEGILKSVRSEVRRSKYEQRCEAEGVLKPNEMFIVMANVNVLRAYYMKENGEVTDLEVMIHVGMIQDSAIIYKDGLTDFRFLFYGGDDALGVLSELRVYHASEELQAVHIKNEGRTNIKIDKIRMKSGTVTKLERKDIQLEGLISPDRT